MRAGGTWVHLASMRLSPDPPRPAALPQVATLACPEVASTVEVRAEVFEPLPSAANAEPEVTALEILSVDGMGLIPSEVIIPKAA